MKGVCRRLSLVACGTLLLVFAGPGHTAFAIALRSQTAPRVYVFTIQGAGLDDLMATPGFLGLAQRGGASLMVSSQPGDVLFEDFGTRSAGSEEACRASPRSTSEAWSASTGAPISDV